MTAGGPIDPSSVEAEEGSGYPEPFASQVGARRKRALGDVTGLRNFGVNLVELPPGAVSSMRHWHDKQDEFVYVLEGELVLVTDASETVLGPGMAAGFPAGVADGHQLANRSDALAVYLEVGDRLPGDGCTYSDVDMLLPYRADGKEIFVRKNGEPY